VLHVSTIEPCTGLHSPHIFLEKNHTDLKLSESDQIVYWASRGASMLADEITLVILLSEHTATFAYPGIPPSSTQLQRSKHAMCPYILYTIAIVFVLLTHISSLSMCYNTMQEKTVACPSY